MFKELEEKSLPHREEQILTFWEEKQIFKRSIEQRDKGRLFSFYDGPPFATGLPHYGHHLAGTIKDVVPRYKTMKGFYVPRRFGWDCHGLPVESEIEKKFHLSGSASIESFGIERFNEECQKIVQRYTKEWRAAVLRMGRWVDFDHVYKTMDLSFMESVWWVFQELYKRGLVYEGFKVMPFSAQLGTPLSNFEAGENYKEVDDPAITVAFKLVDETDTFALAWTTTPWTLLSNMALMVGEDLEYVQVKEIKSGKSYILGVNRLTHYFPDPSSFLLQKRYRGSELVSRRYEPLFPYFEKSRGFQIIAEKSVSEGEGTGIVHAAPAFGEVDFYACKNAELDLVCPVDNNGRFTDEIAEYSGLFVKEADRDLIRRLKSSGQLFHQATIHHRYPYCPRSDTPLIYKAVKTWFVAVEKIKERMVELNSQVHWTPEYIKHKRFGNWLAGARDWAISRNRYWGTPIPLWRAEDGETLVVGSVEELERLTGEKISDLHRHHIDHLLIHKEGRVFRRVPEVFDCWFESGSMPYAQNHFPFENQELFKRSFPADFIAEGLDQTRGWFYTLTILSTILFDTPAFQNVVVNGIILAADGAKMSKRLRNYPDPAVVVSKYGADAVRLYMLHSPAVKADDLSFSEKGVELVVRQVLLPWWNAYSFFITYARLYRWEPEQAQPEREIDRWILSLLQRLIYEVEQGMERYDLSAAVEPFVGFIDQLTNWYIRRSRRRFWQEQDSLDRRQAFATLYHVLTILSRVAAPFVPFISEMIYKNLSDEHESVHLSDFPLYVETERDYELETAMQAVQQSVSLGHALRKEHRLKVRQPLARAYIVCKSANLQEYSQLIIDELNVKEVLFSDNEEQFVAIQAKPNFRVLGKRVGALMPAVCRAVAELSQKELNSLLGGSSVTLEVEGATLQIGAEEVELERIVHTGCVAINQGSITVALDTALTEPLQLEGLARELINKINTMRREAKFAVTDRIEVKIDTTERVEKAYGIYEEFICSEVLAQKVLFCSCAGYRWDLNGEQALISIERIS